MRKWNKTDIMIVWVAYKKISVFVNETRKENARVIIKKHRENSLGRKTKSEREESKMKK